MTVKILVGDCMDRLATLPDGSVHMCMTSPPYFGLRDYGTAEWEGGDAGCDQIPTRSQKGSLKPARRRKEIKWGQVIDDKPDRQKQRARREWALTALTLESLKGVGRHIVQ